MRCIIGIDLGTSRSGYSYAFGPEPSCVKFPQQYTRDDFIGQAKTDTALLFLVSPVNNSWTLDCWGTSAVIKYTRDLWGDAGHQYRLITGKQFKLALCAPDPTQLPPDCQLPRDCPFSASELITLMLTHLRDHARQHLMGSVGFDVDEAEVHYCLSVPAGWSLKAKRVMHHASELAGMTLKHRGSSSSKDISQAHDQPGLVRNAASAVVLVHEQEAAALTACIDPKNDAPTLQAVPGQVWMILDAGGGTVDIAMHQIESSKTHPGEVNLSERLRSRCLLMGSSMLDAQAEVNLLLPLFESEEAYVQWKSEDPQSYISQMRDWEDVKVKFDGNSTGHIKLDYGLIAALQKLGIDPPGVQRGRLPVSAADMSRLVFEPVLQPILANVREMLTAQHSTGRSGADILVLAGGFGSSRYLQQRLHQEFGRMLQRPPVMPNNTATAVVLGNTIHLQRPDAILARVSRLTYGINVAEKPTDSCSQHGRCITDRKGRTWCETHFRTLVRINEVVQIGDETQPVAMFPMPGAEVVQVPIYATEAVKALHITEPGMWRVGVVHIKIEKRHKVNFGFWKAGQQSSDQYKIELRFKFGAAEVQVEAYDATNRRMVSAEFMFSNEAAGAEHGNSVPLPGVGPQGLGARLAKLQL